MRTLPTLLIASSLAFGVPAALADDLVIAPEIGVKFHNDVTVKHYKSHKWDGDVVVGTVLPGDVEYYDVPDEVVVATFVTSGDNATLPKVMFTALRDEVDPTIAAVSVMQILLVSIVLVLIGRFGRGLKDSTR